MQKPPFMNKTIAAVSLISNCGVCHNPNFSMEYLLLFTLSRIFDVVVAVLLINNVKNRINSFLNENTKN